MAEGQIKKGFFFYFGLFVLLLVTIFLVLMVIMMFNPGKSILWMEYFTGNGSYQLLAKTTDTNEAIDWSSVKNIKVECGYANITVEKNNEDKMPKDGVYISNGAKGFRVSKGAVNFSYTVQYDGGDRSKVNIKVSEPNGFMYFSKNIEIVVHADNTSSWNFSDVNFDFTTTSGDIELGGVITKRAQNINIHSVTAATESGSISVTEKFNTSSATGDFVFQTIKGKITSTKQVSANGQNANGFDFASASSLSINVTDKGQIQLPIIKYSGKDLKLTCLKGTINVGYIEAKTISVYSIEGNHLFGTIKGDLSYNNSLDNILSPIITISKIDGSFSLSAVKDNSNPRIKIGEVTEGVHVSTTNGWFEIGKVHGNTVITGTGVGANLTFVEDYNSTIEINTNSGVSLSFMGQIPSNAKIKAAGNVNIAVTNTASFTAQVYNFDAADKPSPTEEDKVPENRITSNVGNSVKNKGEIRIGGGGSVIQIFTNGSAIFNLVKTVD